jgi:hypothetical protein
MPSSTSYRGSGDAQESRRALALWAGVLTGPVALLLVLQVNYVLSYVSCETKQTWFLHVVTASGALLAAAAGFWAWRAGGGGDVPEPVTPRRSEATRAVRRRWMANLAVGMSLWFIIVMLSMSVPPAVLRMCQ